MELCQRIELFMMVPVWASSLVNVKGILIKQRAWLISTETQGRKHAIPQNLSREEIVQNQPRLINMSSQNCFMGLKP